MLEMRFLSLLACVFSTFSLLESPANPHAAEALQEEPLRVGKAVKEEDFRVPAGVVRQPGFKAKLVTEY